MGEFEAEPSEPMTEEEYTNLFKAAAVNGSPRCIYGEAVFFRPDKEAFGPGHIYSVMGKREMQISQCCEYHFDAMFKDDTEEEEHNN